MRKAMIVVAVIAAAALVASPAAADVSPFVGHWEGINEIPGDPNLGDDSRMIINISNGPDGTVNVFFKDFGASACAVDRVVEHEHFLSDVVAGMVLGYLVATWWLAVAGLGSWWRHEDVDSRQSSS